MNYLTRLFAIALLAGTITGLATGLMQELTINPLIVMAEAYESGAVAPGDLGPEVAPFQAEWTRIVTNIATNMIFGFGGALVLGGVMVMIGKTRLKYGFLIGISAFVIFALAPSLGLPPRPPAYPEADLFTRQIWWIATAACTAVGLGMMFLVRGIWAIVAGIALLAIPHIWGAPLVDESGAILPLSLVQQFSLWSLFITGFFWISLGCLSGYFSTPKS